MGRRVSYARSACVWCQRARVSYEEFLKEATAVMPELRTLATIKPGAPDVPIHGDVDEAPLHMLTGRNKLHMSLSEAVGEMVTHFKDLKAKGMLHDRDLGPEPP